MKRLPVRLRRRAWTAENHTLGSCSQPRRFPSTRCGSSLSRDCGRIALRDSGDAKSNGPRTLVGGGLVEPTLDSKGSCCVCHCEEWLAICIPFHPCICTRDRSAGSGDRECQCDALRATGE